ncbi:MAG: hypothetical protein AB1757_16970 [Acidobacteriota bacterium]
MTSQALNWLIKIRAATGVLAIVLSALSPAVALALQPAENVCAMACCISEGNCCCTIKKAFVKGQPHDGKTSLTQTEIAKPCSENCAASTSTVKTVSRNVIHKAVTHAVLFTTLITYSQPPPNAKETFDLTALSPRAPPLC